MNKAEITRCIPQYEPRNLQLQSNRFITPAGALNHSGPDRQGENQSGHRRDSAITTRRQSSGEEATVLGSAKPASGSVPEFDGGGPPAPSLPAWRISLSLLVLSLLLALLVGVAVGTIAFIRWRGIW